MKPNNEPAKSMIATRLDMYKQIDNLIKESSMTQTQRQHTVHTPTPWILQPETDAYTHIIRDENGSIILSMRQRPEERANAQHIVHCVNNYEELLSSAKRYFEITQDPEHYGVEKYEDAKYDLEQAISNAEKK